jgi:hypothetical protein
MNHWRTAGERDGVGSGVSISDMIGALLSIAALSLLVFGS